MCSTQSKAWWSCKERGGTATEVLLLALLIKATNDDYIVNDFVGQVLADSPSYVVGEEWKPPATWQHERRQVPASFRMLLTDASLERKQAATNAAARFVGAGRTIAALPVSSLTTYLGRLLAHKDAALLGVSKQASYKHGAPLRRTYLMPRVARLLQASAEALETAVEAGFEDVAANARAAGSETAPPTPSKVELKAALAESKEEKKDLAATAKKQKRRADQAVRRGIETRKSAKTTASARAEELSSQATAKAKAASKAALARARTAEKAAKSAKAKLNGEARYSPKRVKAMEKAARANRELIEFLEAQVAELQTKLSDATSASDDETWIPQVAQGKGSGRGESHDPLLRLLYMKLITCGVRPNQLNEVRL